jgi:N-methylhydantoinase B
MDQGMNDPVTTEVVRGWLESVTEEMQTTLVKTAHSPLICEARDATCALHDKEGRTIAQASAMPIHLGVLIELGLKFAEEFPEGQAHEGDLYITNDPYNGGTHMPDIAVAAPVFSHGALVGYVSTMAHHRDIGGLMPASVSVLARDLHAEGLRLPLIRLAKGGKINDAVMSVIMAASRTPKSMAGDLSAQIAACHTGVKRLGALYDTRSIAVVNRATRALMDYAERLTRDEIEKIPDGIYTFSDQLDDDAIDPNSDPIKIAVTMTVEGDSLDFDFSGTAPQTRAAINNVMSSTKAIVYYAIRTLTGDRVPNNDGCFKPLTIRAPEGTIVNCTYPAPVASRAVSLFRVEDVVLGVMAQAIPERMIGANSGQYTMVSISGFYPGTNDPMIGQLGGPVTGGHGARSSKDGIDVSSHGCVNGTIDALELGEARFPMIFKEMRLWEDSGGKGKYRGGLGFYAEVEWTRGECNVMLRRERTRFQPWGIMGGGAAPTSRAEHESIGGSITRLPGKIVFPMKSGERLRYWTTGSGGYGSALERDTDSVLEDVLNGRITLDAAYNDYGVVIRNNRVDHTATMQLRESRLTA